MTNDVSPYLQRPVRRLEEVIAEVEQQRLETPPEPIATADRVAGAPNPETASATTRPA